MENLEKTVAERKKQRVSTVYISIDTSIDWSILYRNQEGGSPSTGDFIDMFLDAEVDVSEVQFGEASDVSERDR